jgi:hypothetical protein
MTLARSDTRSLPLHLNAQGKGAWDRMQEIQCTSARAIACRRAAPLGGTKASGHRAVGCLAEKKSAAQTPPHAWLQAVSSVGEGV